ncbi:MAG: hypothetical protein EWM47_11690 [Anaerolineaceae bacterium]|nr:MAG: hypothetical protein EWM47_11690 [Anaerolineaceae bacterium]
MKRKLITTKVIRYLFFLLIIMMLLLGLYLSVLHKNSKGDLSTALNNDELLIDYTIDGSLAYALINTKGTKEYGDFFIVFERKEDTWQRTYENDFKNLMPWKVEQADIDGDNIPEILIALKKTTPYDKEIKNRMFIFNYQNNILARKWTGSRIAGIWREFYPMDLLSTPGHELIFIEQAEEDMEKVSVYSWFDFGFFMIADSVVYPRIQKMTMKSENMLEITYFEEDQEISLLLTVEDGKLLPKKVD